MGDVLIAFCTFPDSTVATAVTKAVVEAGLAACGNILPNVQSIYRWQGKLESSGEVLVIFKLDSHRYSEFETKVRSMHAYEVPEIVAFPLTNGLPAYLDWVRESCK